ncbi:MAG: FAD-dependent oxidoreductase [Prosthecobacter sp.]|nr:FAD-dependent oxidoreductase [Prosthecobacter sp.]
MQRSTAIAALNSHTGPFDIAIVGGGATGLGAAVDAASRGHSVLLVEQSDFAKGTSSRSTKLVHGGVRYLKQGNISLVFEALRERGLLCQNAPHLVHDLAFVIPTYHWWEGPFYGIGLKVYDGLAGRLGLKPSHFLTPEDVLELLPTIETEHLTGGIVYHDGQFDDSRLAINLAQTATEQGAVVINHMACTGLVKDNGHVSGLKLRDAEDSTAHGVHARCVINATGVFADALRKVDDAAATSILRPSQGVHLVLPRDFLPGDTAIMIPKTDDGRVLFAVPWHDCVIIGTTDTPVEHADLEPRALPEEIDFLLAHAARYLTRDPVPADVLSVFAGLRPLVNASHGSTASLSRDHHIEVSDSGLITITGGKWTTYRRMAEDVVDHAELIASLPSRPCRTQELSVHGAGELSPNKLLQHYGSDAAGIEALALPSLVHPKLTLTEAEVRWHVRHEMARTVEDVLARRSRCLLLNARASSEAAPAVAKIMAEELGQDEVWQAHQVQVYQALATGYVLPG